MEFVKRVLTILSQNDPYSANRLDAEVYWEVYQLAVKAYNYGVITKEEFDEIDAYDNRRFMVLMK